MKERNGTPPNGKERKESKRSNMERKKEGMQASKKGLKARKKDRKGWKHEIYSSSFEYIEPQNYHMLFYNYYYHYCSSI
jgi:hypothetical protein